MLVSVMQAASPLAPSDKYPPRHTQQQQQPQQVQHHQSERSFNNRAYQNPEILNAISPVEDQDTNTTVVMTGNGFFVTSSPGSGGLMKSKSGSLPDRYAARGFRDTFVSSMTPPVVASSNSANSSPHHHHHHAMMSNRNEMNSPAKEPAMKESVTPTSGSSNSKKWTFGGLFKRKVKNSHNNSQSPTSARGMSTASPVSGGSMSMSLSSPSPAPSSIVNSASVSTHPNAQQTGAAVTNTKLNESISAAGGPPNKYVSTPTQTRHRGGKLSESDVSSEDSELENESWAKQNQQPVSFKQNFLTRRLSRRKEKAAAKKKAAEAQSSPNGFLKVPPGSSAKLNNGKRVGSSPESLNNGNGNNIFGFGTNGPWPSWEITKKVPQLQAANNYSSSGSLSLSHEGSTRGPRANAKEAVKARAIARRESFFHDSSSEDDGEDRSRSSIQGSHSSLSSRNRRKQPYVMSNNNNYPLTKGQNFRPGPHENNDFIRGSPSSPAKFDYQNNNPSPNFNNRKMVPPGSPRWEARVIYTQENLESDAPFVVKLPKNRQHLNQGLSSSPAGYLMTTEPTSEDQQHQVITAGLKVPISGGQTENGHFITEEVHYANLPNNGIHNNNMRYRSATPLNYPGGYINPSPPPPPPPRRDFNRQVPVNHLQNNSNFYRPVSCSYLDSYQGFYNNNPPRVASPNLNAAASPPVNMSFNSATVMPDTRTTEEEYFDTQTESPAQAMGNNGNYQYEQDQVDNSRHFFANNNNFLVPNPKKHMGLIRSPSEPPEIKVQYARESPIKRNASTPSPAPYHYSNQDSFTNSNNKNEKQTCSKSIEQQEQPVITSKLGFPVRRLHEANKLPAAQSPVHMRASEFWRKKEAEVTGNPVQPNPNHKKYMNRIRSADSSPLPIHRMRISPAVQNSNESISSLSSFSAEAGSPHMFANNNKSSGGGGGHVGRKTPNQINNSGQSPKNNQNPGKRSEHNNSPGKNTGHSSSPRQNGGVDTDMMMRRDMGSQNSGRASTPSQQSACERLKVRIPSAPSATSDAKEESKKIRSLVDLNNGKTPGRNLEDALNELEDMYKSLRLSDEDLLDRAERRDLPTTHQELRNLPLIPLPQSYQQQAFKFEPLGSVESVATGSSSGSGTNYSSGDNPNRVRAPPLRRSSRPDTVTDDMARRRFDNQETKPLDPRNVVSKTGSYMVLSPAFSPPVSPCPPETLPLSFITMGQHEDPDLTLDDVTFRQYRKANSIRIIDPQPPFGIPLGPITAAPGSDYLHSKRSDRLRPLFKHTKNPDLVNDDIAFRNLRKDLNSENNLSKDWTPRLFSPTRDNVFNYNDNINPPSQRDKKLRAIRSLSANITNFIPFADYTFNTSDIGKWNSFTDLNRRPSSNSPSSSANTQHSIQKQRRASTYLQPSWVEQIEKVQTSTETLTENRNSNNKFASEPEQHWEKKLPSKTVQLTPELYDPTKPRRPWTDIILDSFEKEKQQEIERIAQETAAANAAKANSNDINDASHSKSHSDNNIIGEIAEEDDDVFLDAREESKSASPEDRKKDSRQASSHVTPNEPKLVHTTMIDNNKFVGFPLLTGQKNRRGSWVEPRSSSHSYLSSSDFAEEDQRRKSWSDLPKDIDSPLSTEFPLSSSPGVKNKLFTPLPQPKKIKQINLEAFNTSTPNKENCLKAGAEDVQIPFSPILRGEEQLNELMDLLIRERDTCGPKSTTSSSSSSENKTTHDVNLREEENERVKPSISSGMTQKDILDGKTLVSLPKIPLKESPVDEPTRQRSKSKETLLKEDIASVVNVPEVVYVTRKHASPTTTTRHNDSNSSEKIDNDSIADVNVIGNSISFTTSSTTTTTDSKPSVMPSSIEELIDSINESLPELEASCATHNKSNESSLSTGSPPSSIPSPRAGSPTTVTLLPLKTLQEELSTREIEEFQVDNQASKNEEVVQVKGESEPQPPPSSSQDGNESVTRIEEKVDDLLWGATPQSAQSSSSVVEGERRQSESTSRKNSTSSTCNNDTVNPKAGTSTGMMVTKSPEGELSSRIQAQDWFARWNGVLLVACYLLAFLHTAAQIDFLPFLGIFLAVLVFIAHLF